MGGRRACPSGLFGGYEDFDLAFFFDECFKAFGDDVGDGDAFGDEFVFGEVALFHEFQHGREAVAVGDDAFDGFFFDDDFVGVDGGFVFPDADDDAFAVVVYGFDALFEDGRDAGDFKGYVGAAVGGFFDGVYGVFFGGSMMVAPSALALA